MIRGPWPGPGPGPTQDQLPAFYSDSSVLPLVDSSTPLTTATITTTGANNRMEGGKQY